MWAFLQQHGVRTFREVDPVRVYRSASKVVLKNQAAERILEQYHGTRYGRPLD